MHIVISIKTAIACTSPCLTGWLVCAAAAAFGAEPMPASFEKSPLFMPITITLPANPPKIALKSKALSMIILMTAGISLKFKTIAMIASKM